MRGSHQITDILGRPKQQEVSQSVRQISQSVSQLARGHGAAAHVRSECGSFSSICFDRAAHRLHISRAIAAAGWSGFFGVIVSFCEVGHFLFFCALTNLV